MNRRLVPVLLVLLPLWWGALHAQSGELESYMDRGRALSKAGKLDQALPYFLLSLELAETRFGADDPALIPMIDDLAGAQAAIENYRDAEPLYERALKIQEREAARHQIGIVRTLNKLGGIYEATARAPQALDLYRRVITTWAPVLGGDHPDVRIAGGRLAKLALKVPGKAPAKTVKKTAKPKAKPAPKPKPKPQVAKQTAAPAGQEPSPGFSVHLTSIRKRQDADAEWDRLRRVHGALLGDLELRVAKADLGAKRGVYYRIKGGTMAREEARARCAAFAARGVWCGVTGPEDAGAPPLAAAQGKFASVKPVPPAKAAQEMAKAAQEMLKAGPEPALGYLIHLTSIRDPDAAAGEWRRLRRLHGKLLGDLTLSVARADLGSKGIYYRVRGGGLSRQDARALCAKFTARKIWCRVVRPGEAAAESTLRLALQRGRRRPWRHGGTRRRLLYRRCDPGCRRSPFTGVLVQLKSFR